MTSKFKLNKYDLINIFFILLAIATTIFLTAYRRPIDKDVTIIFDGAYRINLGQIPYKDFFIPLGPITFYIQAFCNLFFGVTYSALIAHSTIIGSIFALFFYLLTREDLGKPTAAILAFFSHVSLYGSMVLPWYNQTAYFFFLTNILLLIPLSEENRKEELRIAYLSAILSVLSFFSKHDIGMLHFASINAFLIFGEFRNRKKMILIYVFFFLFLTALTIAYFESLGEFLNWFNLGGNPESNRFLRMIEDLVRKQKDWQIIALISVFCFLRFKKALNIETKRHLLLILVLLIVPVISASTSGAGSATTRQGITIIFFLIYKLSKNFTQRNSQLKLNKFARILIIVLCFVILEPSFLVRSIVSNLNTWPSFNGKPNPFYQSSSKITKSHEAYTRIKRGSYVGVLILKETYGKIQEHIETLPENINFLNASRYTFLTVDKKVIPLTGLPLWYHKGVTYSRKDFKRIKEKIISEAPDAIFLEDTHLNIGESLFDELIIFFEANNYNIIFSIEEPSSQKRESVFLKKK